MMSIKPAESQPYILTFDGVVLEIFAKFRDEAHRLRHRCASGAGQFQVLGA